MACPTCSHSLHSLGEIDGRKHYHCPRCGTHRMVSVGGWVHDTVPKVVECLRGFVRMIDDTSAGRWFRQQAETAGVLESTLLPGDRPQ